MARIDDEKLAWISLCGRLLDRATEVAKYGIVAVGMVLVARELGGRVTIAQLSATILTRMGEEADDGWLRWLPWGIWGITTIWAVAERRLRHRAIQRLSGQLSLMRHKLDPMKQSSGLATNGQTRPEDE